MNPFKKLASFVLPVAVTLSFSQAALSAATFTGTGTLGGSGSITFYLGSGGGVFSNVLSTDGSTLVGMSDLPGDTEIHAFRWKNGTMTDLGTLGGDNSVAYGVSGDGNTVVGVAENNSGEGRAFRWNGGSISDLGTLGGDSSFAIGISTDGSTIIGNSEDEDSFTRAFRWKSNSMQDLGTLGGDNSSAVAVSANGDVVVGEANDINGDTHAFRWEGGTMDDLGVVAGGNSSRAMLVSNDGSVVAGMSELNGGGFRAFRWTGGTMTNLGTLGGNMVFPVTLSGDGSSVGGYSYVAGDASANAFIWKNGTMTDIGTLGGSITAISSFSTDGSIAVGTGFLPGDTGGTFFRWTQAGGKKLLSDILAENNVNTTGWTIGFIAPVPVWLSADGSVMGSTGIYNGNAAAFLMSYTGNGVVLITPEELAKSLGPATTATSQQTQSSVSAGIGQSLFATQQAMSSFFSPSMGSSNVKTSAAKASGMAAGSPVLPPQRAAYAVGSLGIGQNNDFNNYSGSGTTGLFFRVNPELAIGAGLTASGSHTELHLGGRSRITSTGGALNVAYEEKSGWRFYGTAGASRLDVSMRRHYMNGGGVSSSRGDTDGVGYGLAGRGGYSFALASGDRLMPYLDLSYAHTDLNGYTERSGGAPATYGDQSSDIVISRLGAELTHDVNTQLQLRGRAAWGHEVSARGNTLTATSLTVTTAVPYASGSDKSWLEGGLTGIWSLDSATSLTADLQAKAGKTGEPALAATVGLTVGF